MTLEIAPEAERDLDQMYDFIARDSPTAAERVLRSLAETFQRLAAGELNGPRARMRSGQMAYRWSAPPYRIYYRRSADLTQILRVYHQARRPIER